MSNQEEAKNTITVLDSGKETDITPQELDIVRKYQDNGLPGIRQVSDAQMSRALDLYLSGKTYFEISKTVNIKKEIVLYLAYKFNWYHTKIDQLEILDSSLKERILHAKLMNQDFLLQIQQFFLSKIGKKMSKFMATGDEEIAAQLNKKDLEYYFKAVDLLDKITTAKVPTSKSPTVGLNMGDQEINIKKVSEHEVVITPKQKTTAEMLKELADLKRKEDLSPENSRDIMNEDSQPKKEENK